MKWQCAESAFLSTSFAGLLRLAKSRHENAVCFRGAGLPVVVGEMTSNTDERPNGNAVVDAGYFQFSPTSFASKPEFLPKPKTVA